MSQTESFILHSISLSAHPFQMKKKKKKKTSQQKYASGNTNNKNKISFAG